MFFITVETLVVCDATSHIEWHRHLADTDTEQGSKLAMHINLYPPNPYSPHTYTFGSHSKKSLMVLLEEVYLLKIIIYMQIISVYICTVNN